jgi:molybdopterin synthase catalytic subunit
VRIQAGDFDISAEINALTGGRADIGAVVSFTGLCRDEGGRLSALNSSTIRAWPSALSGRLPKRL